MYETFFFEKGRKNNWIDGQNNVNRELVFTLKSVLFTCSKTRAGVRDWEEKDKNYVNVWTLYLDPFYICESKEREKQLPQDP